MGIEILIDNLEDMCDLMYGSVEHELKLITTNFYEGEKVTVEIDGKQYTRRVYWDGFTKDLYIVVNNYKYFKIEF